MSSLVSIGIPVTERVEGLSLTIDSLIEQSHSHFEVILVDDTNNESTGAVCVDEAERDDRIIYVKTPGHFGVLPSTRKPWHAAKAIILCGLAWAIDWIENF